MLLHLVILSAPMVLIVISILIILKFTNPGINFLMTFNLPYPTTFQTSWTGFLVHILNSIFPKLNTLFPTDLKLSFLTNIPIISKNTTILPVSQAYQLKIIFNSSHPHPHSTCCQGLLISPLQHLCNTNLHFGDNATTLVQTLVP